MKIHADMVAAGLAIAIGLTYFVTRFVYPNEPPPDEGYGIVFETLPPKDDRRFVQYVYIKEIKCGSDALEGDAPLKRNDRVVRLNNRSLTWINEKELETLLNRLQYPSGKLILHIERQGRQLIDFDRVVKPQKVDWTKNCG